MIKDGIYKEFWSSGLLKIQSCYKNHKLHGEYYEWHEKGNFYPNSRLKIYVNYTNGLKNGNYLEWWQNGIIRIKAYYKNDVLDGEYLVFNKDGSRSEEIRYILGVKNYHKKFYLVNGFYMSYDIKI